MPSTPRRHRKHKLNLTVTAAFRRQAKELATSQHRSISNLFEHLVAMEKKRAAREEREERARELHNDDPENGHRLHAVSR